MEKDQTKLNRGILVRKKRFLFPWEKKVTLTCPTCNSKIQTVPLWPGEKPEDRIPQLQKSCCHIIDASLIKQAPVLSENDVKCAQKLKEYRMEYYDERGERKTAEAMKPLLVVKDGPPEIFLRHGIFPLLSDLTETGLKILYLFLSMNPTQMLIRRFFMELLRTSSPNVSTIIKRLRNLKIVTVHKIPVKGRRNGRQICLALSTASRQRLEKDLLEYDFFREAVRNVVRPLALNYSTLRWRTDIGLLNRENEQRQATEVSKIG
jgi:hypothetical protein